MGMPLRATEPWPFSAVWSRSQANDSLIHLAHTLHLPEYATQHTVPLQQSNQPASLHHTVQNIANVLSAVAYLRVADRTSTTLFCIPVGVRRNTLIPTREGYTMQTVDGVSRILSSLKSVMAKNYWLMSKARSLPLLYLPGKAKSLLKGCILWQPIAACGTTSAALLPAHRCSFFYPLSATSH